MDLEPSEENLKYLSRKELYSIRKEKLRKEIESAKNLSVKGIDPLKVADEFIHNIFKLMEDGISRRNPELNTKEIHQKIRESLAIKEKIKSLRKRG